MDKERQWPFPLFARLEPGWLVGPPHDLVPFVSGEPEFLTFQPVQSATNVFFREGGDAVDRPCFRVGLDGDEVVVERVGV